VAAQVKRALFFEDLANKKRLRKVKISLDKKKVYSHLCSPQTTKESSGCTLKKRLEKIKK
jgi:hypothetical protein